MPTQNTNLALKAQNLPMAFYADPLNLKLIEAVEQYARILNAAGHRIQPHSPKAIHKLTEVSREHKNDILNYLLRVIAWTQEVKASGDVEEGKDSFSEEAILRTALRHYGFHVSDEFWKTMDDETIVEIYGENMIQLYRSMNFYEFTGYSLLDLSVFEWYVLWERPKRVMDMMATEAEAALQSTNPLQDFKIPRHIIREIMDTGQTEPFVPRAGFVEFKKLASLKKNPLSREAVGLICTCKGLLIAEGDEALNIEFV